MRLGNMQINLPQAIVLAAGLLALGAVLTWAPAETQAVVLEWLGWGVAGASALLGPLLRAQTPAEEGAQRRARRRAALDDTRRGGPPSTGAAALALAVLAACSVTASGCGASALRHHSTAVVSLAGAHSLAYSVRDAARDAALDLVEAQHPEHGADREAALRAEDARWRPSGAALDALRVGLGTWVEALDAARRADAGEDDLIALLTPVAARAIQLFGRVADLLRTLGVEDAPALPPILEALAGAAVGR